MYILYISYRVLHVICFDGAGSHVRAVDLRARNKFERHPGMGLARSCWWDGEAQVSDYRSRLRPSLTSSANRCVLHSTRHFITRCIMHAHELTHVIQSVMPIILL
jgi:hypothetical protein